MDRTDRKIINLLGADARRSLADIGAAVGLSQSAVNERIRKLQATGVIRRFTVEVSHRALDESVLVFIQLLLAADTDEEAFRRAMARHPDVLECHHVSGRWSYLLKLRFAVLGDVEAFLGELKRAGYIAASETIITLSTARERSFRDDGDPS
ncbi:Lrp/AsnC family transcriptional regulator [Martelella alba]|uniref:Lrp/AsnC family transcriptional regulator n=1 Tax=Martelella alba TaxID=2590451 RepID=A0A506U5Y5_9HYPH|nr:Lrp/AsnC family transcriptional regulator [Martelella alba]TPW29792.1 Lrp/AsnC family transcriptional regulator [Martelella alba]